MSLWIFQQKPERCLDRLRRYSIINATKEIHHTMKMTDEIWAFGEFVGGNLTGEVTRMIINNTDEMIKAIDDSNLSTCVMKVDIIVTKGPKSYSAKVNTSVEPKTKKFKDTVTIAEEDPDQSKLPLDEAAQANQEPKEVHLPAPKKRGRPKKILSFVEPEAETNEDPQPEPDLNQDANPEPEVGEEVV